jgi:NAD(P)-dependent dehydrogenase (short-subunit alcohol dehydrogenase family)
MSSQQNRRVLVTGASKGIGRAILRRLQQDGYWVTGIARTRPNDLEPGAEFHECDLMDATTTRTLVEKLAREGAFYGVVNNAAIGPLTSLEDCTIRDMQDTFQVNIIGSLVCAQAAVPGMRALGTGRIINFSSRAALGKENRTAYSATKAGLIGVTRTWALELAPHNITVNIIAPGPIETDGYREGNPPNDPRTKALLASVPLRRIGQPEEIAHAVAFLLHDLSGFMTGQTLHIDGGMTVTAVKIG